MTQIKWRKRKDHPKTFQNGETMLVCAISPNVPHRIYKQFAIVVCVADDEGRLEDLTNWFGEAWGWEWEHVVKWVPIAEIEATLPKPPEVTP